MSKILDLSREVKYPVSSGYDFPITKKYFYPSSRRPYLTVENGRVVRIMGLSRSFAEWYIRMDATTRHVSEAEIHAAFIHQAEHYGAPFGDPMEGVFLRWRHRNSVCPRCRRAA